MQGLGDKEVARTLAAVQALESSVRAGSAFYQQPQQQLEQSAAMPPHPKVPVGGPNGSGSSRRRRPSKQRSELCPQLLQQLQGGHNNSQKFIEATQKVGSLMYMAPEVLTGAGAFKSDDTVRVTHQV
jgi:hypothetical protein